MRKLSESIWSDIQDRSSGDTIRKEDDVNHMNFDTFADYIKDNYSEKGDWFSVVESDNERSRHIEIDIISGIDLSFNVVDGKIYNILIHNNVNKYIDVPGLKKVFNVNVLGSSTYSVLEKDWTKSNNTFVKLIEFFLKKKTNESIWSDIQDRSAGETVRKEDDVDNLDIEGFYDYLNDHYEPTLESSYKIRLYNDINVILVPVSSSDGKHISPTYINHLEIDFDPNDITETRITMSSRYLLLIHDIEKKLRDNFCVIDKMASPTRGKYICIYPKDGGESAIVTNSFFIKVLDFLLEELDGKHTILLKKK